MKRSKKRSYLPYLTSLKMIKYFNLNICLRQVNKYDLLDGIKGSFTCAHKTVLVSGKFHRAALSDILAALGHVVMKEERLEYLNNNTVDTQIAAYTLIKMWFSIVVSVMQ